MRGETIIQGRPGASAPTSAVLATGDLTAEGYRRLSFVSGVIAGVVLVFLAVWILEAAAGGDTREARDVVFAGILVAFSLTIAIGSRRGLFRPRAFVALAMTTEVFCAFALSFSVLGWQRRLGPEGIAWLRDGVGQPFDLGTGNVPWSGLWIVLFATLIPMRPRQHLAGALLAVSPLLFGPFLSVALYGQAPELGAGGFEATLHVAVWLFFRGAVAVGIAYFAARSVHGLRKSLAKARRMGSYQLKEKLGEGGMGEVWIADHQMLARSAAIKLIKADGASGAGWNEVTERFQREVQATAQLRSPHTVEIYDYGLTEDGTFYYVMELLDGLNLEDLVRAHGPVPWARAVHILIQACHSLGEAHARGLVHRDIKPANIFLCRIGRDLDQVKVLDFGLVKTTGPARGADAGLTQQDAFVGTPAYAAPEVATHAGVTDARSDIYSLGCVAFWLVTGRRVFEAPGAVDMLIKHAKDPPPPPSQVTEMDIPADVDRIVLECLAKEPRNRPASVDDLAGSLRATGGAGGWTVESAARWWALHRPPAPATYVAIGEIGRPLR